MKCDKCGQDYAGNDCPNKRNAPMRSRKSRKTWLKVLIAAASVLLVLTGCVNSDKHFPGKEPYENQPAGNKADTAFGLNETAALPTIRVTATEIKESAGSVFFEPGEGNVFVGVKFTIENVSDADQTISSILLFDAYADGVKCSYSVSAACAFTDGTLDGTVAPGKKLVGWYAVEVPKEWSALELQVKSSWLSNNTAVFVFEK